MSILPALRHPWILSRVADSRTNTAGIYRTGTWLNTAKRETAGVSVRTNIPFLYSLLDVHFVLFLSRRVSNAANYMFTPDPSITVLFLSQITTCLFLFQTPNVTYILPPICPCMHFELICINEQTIPALKPVVVLFSCRKASVWAVQAPKGLKITFWFHCVCHTEPPMMLCASHYVILHQEIALISSISILIMNAMIIIQVCIMPTVCVTSHTVLQEEGNWLVTFKWKWVNAAV